MSISFSDHDILIGHYTQIREQLTETIISLLPNRNKHSPPSHEHPLLIKNPHDLVLNLEIEYGANKVPDLSSFTTPRLFFTHSPLRYHKSALESKCLFLFGSLPSKFADMFSERSESRGPFWDHVLNYWKSSLENPEKDGGCNCSSQKLMVHAFDPFSGRFQESGQRKLNRVNGHISNKAERAISSQRTDRSKLSSS
ncbi:hypothetical protein Leryth_019118 [Lithospermum erythrorhizon]|nr:hypothetical protein Leryth_019118 [Lithospermum erythrorhizon]